MQLRYRPRACVEELHVRIPSLSSFSFSLSWLAVVLECRKIYFISKSLQSIKIIKSNDQNILIRNPFGSFRKSYFIEFLKQFV